MSGHSRMSNPRRGWVDRYLSDKYRRRRQVARVLPRKPPLSSSVRETIDARISSGELAAGSRLLPEPELAGEMGVSRATLREALRALEDEGVLTRVRGAGTFVTRRVEVRNSLDVNFGVTEA